jgi:CheY-like chemotaxis protein
MTGLRRPVRSVMVVEDDDDARAAICELLAARGFVSYAVGDGARALALLDELRDDPPGCIVLDLDLPVMNGWELLERLRARSDAPPVIVLSGEEDEPPGARYYLRKPPFIDMLLRAVVSCCLR